ncbi:MAG TPA: rhodanese-like domain-containing protein [Candidatus Limnocylindria bacterium]|nr:rhodanese-like domain-containing protein [Candidatus Limnocylindria bacterium]
MDVVRSPLLSVDHLKAWLDGGEQPVIVDVRWYLGKPGAGHAAYLEGHLPGAIFLDLDHDLADLAGYGSPGRHPLPSPEAFRSRMAAAGIADGARVVGYDDVGGWVAARLWWMLDSLGLGRRGIEGEWAGVLDGGVKAWAEAGHALETEEPALPVAPAALTLGNEWRGAIERDSLRDRLGTVTLLDARAAARYRGEIEPVDPVAGHIPTAINAPVDTNLDVSGRFLGPGALRARYGELGITPDSEGEVVVSCGSGTSAAHHSLAMRAAGLPDPILYVGSYSDWSRSGEDIATGAEPGPPPAPRPSESPSSEALG